jgi:multimeric flavodoxin WrbA
MRILALSGSPRGDGKASRLLDAFVAGARRAGAGVDRVELHELELDACVGSGCDDGCCVESIDAIRESFSDLCRQVRSADLLVVASPVFPDGISSRVRVLLDRCDALRAAEAGAAPSRRALTGRGVLIAVGPGDAGCSGNERLYDEVRVAASALFENAGKVPSGLFVYPLGDKRVAEKASEEAEMAALGERFARDPFFGVQGDLATVH